MLVVTPVLSKFSVSQKLKRSFIIPTNPGEIFHSVKAVFTLVARARSTIRVEYVILTQVPVPEYKGRFPFVWKNRCEFSIKRNSAIFSSNTMELDECVPLAQIFFSC